MCKTSAYENCANLPFLVHLQYIQNAKEHTAAAQVNKHLPEYLYTHTLAFTSTYTDAYGVHTYPVHTIKHTTLILHMSVHKSLQFEHMPTCTASFAATEIKDNSTNNQYWCNTNAV